MDRFFIGIATFIVLLCVISGYDVPINVKNIVELTLWCSFVPVFFAFLFCITQRDSEKTRFVLGSIFIVSSALTLKILGLTAYAVVKDGPLNESSLIFIVMPFIHFKSIGYGLILGLVAYYVRRTIQRHA